MLSRILDEARSSEGKKNPMTTTAAKITAAIYWFHLMMHMPSARTKVTESLEDRTDRPNEWDEQWDKIQTFHAEPVFSFACFLSNAAWQYTNFQRNRPEVQCLRECKDENMKQDNREDIIYLLSSFLLRGKVPAAPKRLFFHLNTDGIQ